MILLAIETGMRAGEIIFIAAAMNQITACVTAKQIADIHYMTKKAFKGQAHVDYQVKSSPLLSMTFLYQ